MPPCTRGCASSSLCGKLWLILNAQARLGRPLQSCSSCCCCAFGHRSSSSPSLHWFPRLLRRRWRQRQPLAFFQACSSVESLCVPSLPENIKAHSASCSKFLIRLLAVFCTLCCSESRFAEQPAASLASRSLLVRVVPSDSRATPTSACDVWAGIHSRLTVSCRLWWSSNALKKSCRSLPSSTDEDVAFFAPYLNVSRVALRSVRSAVPGIAHLAVAKNAQSSAPWTDLIKGGGTPQPAARTLP